MKRARQKAIPGYSYAAFCLAIADRDGADCWVRRNLPLDPGQHACDGALDGHHLLSKQWLKREIARDLPAGFSLGEVLSDARNGILVCRRHHDLLERALLHIGRERLPGHVEAFADELGLRALGRLERDYGPDERLRSGEAA